MATTPTPAASRTVPAPAVGTVKPKPKPTSGRPSLDAQVDLIRIMYYGDPGKGKTTAMAGMARLGKIVFIDAENRLKAGPLKRLGIPTENIEKFDKPVSYDNLEEFYFELKTRLDNGEPIVGIAWDSITETARTILQTTVDLSVQRSLSAGKTRSAWSTEIGDYGDMTEQMRRLIRRFRDLPVHLACSCLPNRDTDENGAIRVAPALTPAVLRDFMGYMDLVFHARMELIDGEEEYSALTRPIGTFEAKDSFGVMPRVLVNPSFDRVLGYVSGDLDAKTDPVQIKAKEARERVAAAAAAAAT